MSTEKSKPDIEAANRILSQISLLCSVITDQIKDRDTTDEELVLQSHFQRIGMLSDLASAKLGEQGFRGADASSWLMP